MQTTEGRVVKSSDGAYTYEYYLRDHLGSVRVRFSKGDNQQASLSGGVHYYPFGMIIGGLSEETEGTTDHLFGGKRLLNQDLGGTQANWYDFGARNYDAQLGMWFNVDPLAEKYVSHTPYNYCFGNPINFVDPTGMEPDNYKPWYWNEDVHGKWSWFDNYREGLYTTDFYFRTGNDAGISSRGLLDASIAMYGENSDYAQWYDSGVAGNWDDIKGKGGYFVWEYDRSRGRSSKWEAVVAYKKTWVCVAQSQGVDGDPPSGENNTPEFSLHWTDGIGPGLIGLGANILPTRGKFAGATKGTSIASKYLSKAFPQKMSTRVMGTRVLGRAVGRFVPYVGWAWTFGEILYHGSQENTRQLQNNGIDPYNYGRILNDFKCFAAGTKVTMGDMTYKNIENIVVGDSVLTYNFKAKKLEVNIVQQIEDPIHHKLIKIAFRNGEDIISTDDHPYYVKGKGWCSFNPEKTQRAYGLETEKLEVSDFCFTIKKNKLRRVQVIEIMQYEESIKTYNLSKISNSNNYFVNGILVHNESK